MEEEILNFCDRRPQRLCKMCGKCCRVVVPSVPYEKLKEMAARKDQEALDFLVLFEPYPTVADAMAVDEAIVKNIPDYEKRTFFRCRFLDGNLCTKYVRNLKEERLAYKVRLKYTQDESTRYKLQQIIDSIDENVALYSKYGSER